MQPWFAELRCWEKHDENISEEMLGSRLDLWDDGSIKTRFLLARKASPFRPFVFSFLSQASEVPESHRVARVRELLHWHSDLLNWAAILP